MPDADGGFITAGIRCASERLLAEVPVDRVITLDGASPGHFILIDRALRNEGTSYHYTPPALQ